MFAHVALDLHREELGGEHQATLAVPGSDAPLLGQRVESPPWVLVEADHERDLRRAGHKHRVGSGERRAAGGASVLDVDERDACQAEDRNRRSALPAASEPPPRSRRPPTRSPRLPARDGRR